MVTKVADEDDGGDDEVMWGLRLVHLYGAGIGMPNQTYGENLPPSDSDGGRFFRTFDFLSLQIDNGKCVPKPLPV